MESLHEWHWSLHEEKYIVENAGKQSVEEMSQYLGRSKTAITFHAHEMRREGRLEASLRFRPFKSELTECPECKNMRSHYEGTICLVCHKKKLLDGHIESMKVAYEELPLHIRERTNGTFALEHRNPPAMPMPPDTRDMTVYQAMKADDQYARALEKYELQLATLDINAAKQRVSKWRRKTAAVRKNLK